jgi:hypothetical protein
VLPLPEQGGMTVFSSCLCPLGHRVFFFQDLNFIYFQTR